MIIRLVRFCLPIIILLLFLYSPLIIIGEDFLVQPRIKELIDSDQDYLIGFLHNEQTRIRYLKVNQLIETKPEIISLGSSRVLQFRQEMFGTKFYNFGYTGSTLDDFEKIIEEIIEKKEIKYLIFGLDHWMFNPLWVEKQKPIEKLENESLFSLSPLKAIKLIRSKHFFHLLTKIELRNRALGINALWGNGLRRDGSYQYGELIASVANGDTTAEDYKFKNTLTRILNKNNRFESFVQFDLR